MVHPECWVFHAMPHPPLHIWAHPRDWNLQPLYLSTFIQLLRVLSQKSRVIYLPHLGKAQIQASSSKVV